METLNRAQKCSILGPQNLGSPPDPRLENLDKNMSKFIPCWRNTEK